MAYRLSEYTKKQAFRLAELHFRYKVWVEKMRGKGKDRTDIDMGG